MASRSVVDLQSMKMNKPMKKSASPIPQFQNGQVWRMGKEELQISLVGTWLVHYRHLKDRSRNKRPLTRFSGKREFGELLIAHKASLVPG